MICNGHTRSCTLNYSTCFRTVGKENAVVEEGETTEYIEHLLTQTYNYVRRTLLNVVNTTNHDSV